MNMNLPTWANEILISKGIGFESQDVKDVIWSFFYENHYSDELDQIENERQFYDVVGYLIKNGYVTKAIDHMKVLAPQKKLQPIRRSQLAQFEEKATRLLARFE